MLLVHCSPCRFKVGDLIKPACETGKRQTWSKGNYSECYVYMTWVPTVAAVGGVTWADYEYRYVVECDGDVEPDPDFGEFNTERFRFGGSVRVVSVHDKDGSRL